MRVADSESPSPSTAVAVSATTVVPSSSSSSDQPPSLHALLVQADLLRYESGLVNDLRLRHAGDIQYVDEDDLTAIGMSRPEQKRLRKDYQKMFPRASFVGRLKKVFSKDEKRSDTNGDAMNGAAEHQHVIPIERVTLCKELGRGEFGTVHQAIWRHGATPGETMQVAVKCVSSEKLLSAPANFLSEAAIMHRMQHDDVVRLFGVVLDTRQIMMVSELATCGSLLSCLKRPALRDSFPVHILCNFAVQIARGMSYLEAQRLIHRDLAARNVLVFSSTKVKISDFGLSRSLGVGEDYYRGELTPSLRLPIAWCAPECINFLKFTPASDVWAFGVTLWEMFTYGEMPWDGLSGAEILDAVDRERRLLPRPHLCPDDMHSLMVECWTHSPDSRPTFAAILASLPDRMPLPVRAIVTVSQAPEGHLTFAKEELIYVIDKTRDQSPSSDGALWLGSLKNGKTGLFKPTDTVAHLGAEPPAPNKSETPEKTAPPAKEGKKKKEEKESERDRMKRLISEPQAVRHTSHLGIDGTSFGLLQMDKKDIRMESQQPSPSSLRSTTSTPSIPGTAYSVASSSFSPPMPRAPSQPPLFPRGTAQIPPVARQPMPSAPPLTPELSDSSCSGGLCDAWAAGNSNSFSSNSTLDTIVGVPRGGPGHQRPIHAVYAHPSKCQNGDISPSLSAEDTALADELTDLVRDMTNFSLDSMASSTASDTRPLLTGRVPGPPTTSTVSSSCVSTAAVRLMNEEEMARLREKQRKEHKRAGKELAAERAKSLQAIQASECSAPSPLCDPMASSWSAEAQEAYRLLVECGNGLSATPPPTTVDGSTVCNGSRHSSAPASPLPSPSAAPGLPPRRQEAPPPPRPPKTGKMAASNGTSAPSSYDNLSGFGAGGKKPPPVPPKPKVTLTRPSSATVDSPTRDDYGREFTSAVQQSSLFTKTHREEVIKF